MQVLDRAAWQCRNGWSGAPFTLGAVIEKSDTEVFDALVVLEPEHGSRVLAQRSAAPVAQTAAVAAGGLVAGAVLARLYQVHFDAAEVRRQQGGEMGWILETNTAMNRGMEAMGGKVVKRYRVYERVL